MRNLQDKYEVTVIIPTYNRDVLLSYTLDSLIKQNIPVSKFEVVIGDDGSSDNTREMLTRYEKLLNVKYAFQEDLGYRPASARNMAIRLAEGKICLFVDSGVMLDANCISEHIHFHAKKDFPVSAIGYVYGFDHNEESEELLMRLVSPADPTNSIKRLSHYEVFRDVREPHYIKYKDKLEDLQAPWYYFWTCHLSIARKDLFQVGLFDEKYDGRWGVEDNDLGFRLHQMGVKICLLRTAQSIHYPHGKNKSERQMEGYFNCIYFNEKFNTIETGLFLESYTKKSMTLEDINELSLNLTKKVSAVIPDSYLA